MRELEAERQRTGSAWPITRLIEGERCLQGALERVDLFVHRLHAQCGIDAAVEIDDLAVVGLAHAHIMDVADDAALRCEFRQRDLRPP